MPELPEVETIKNELTPYVVGRKITAVRFFWEGILKKTSVEEFLRRVIGQQIERLTRRGKYLLFRLGSGEILVMHMKLTGSLLINVKDAKFVRAAFELDDGTVMAFRDPRKFGAMWLTDDEGTVAAKLGPEPLQKGFTEATLAKILGRRAAPVKAVLLDQKIIAGIGNMYADESLFEAGIHPGRPALSLTQAEVRRLYKAMRRVLRAAIASKGASVRNYLRPDGEPGTAHEEFRVAHGVGKNCPGCGGPIQRIVVRGRGTYFCPECQRLQSSRR